MALYEKADWIALIASIFFMIMVAIVCLIGKPWFSIPFIIGLVVSFLISLHIGRKSQAISYRYRRILWGNNFSRFFMQFLPPLISPLVFILSNSFLHSLASSYILSALVGIGASLVFPYLFSASFKKITSPDLDDICKDLPFEFKRKRVMETPEDLPVMNAWVAGIINPVLVATSSLLQHLSQEELKAVLLHEVGHIRGRHLFISSIYTIFCTPFCLLLFYVGHIFWGFIALLFFIITFFWLHHLFEIEADMFAVRVMGENGAVMIDALQKMFSINKETVSRVFEIEAKEGEASITHPSLDKRVERIKGFLKERGACLKP